MTKISFKTALLAAAPAFALAVSASPAQAQVSGIAVAEAAVAIASSTAVQNGLNQVGTTYAAQIQQIEQLSQQRQTQIQTLDTNGDGQLDQNEQASLNENNPVIVQINQLDQQIQTATAPIQLARLYVVSQVAQQYAPAVQQVISDKNIQIMLSPEAVVYAPDAANVTQAVADALNARVSSVQVTPPQGWQPTQQAVDLFQQVSQVFAIARQQQAAAQQGGAAEVPSR